MYYCQIVFDFLLAFVYSFFMLFKAATIGPLEAEVIKRVEEARHRLRHNLARPRRSTGLLRGNTFARGIQGSNSIEAYNVTAEDAIAAAEGEEPLDANREAWLPDTR